MIDLNRYPNIAGYIQSKGGIKEKLINKKTMQDTLDSWDLLTPEELNALEQQVPYGLKAFDALVTSTAIILCSMWTARCIPVKNILWMFTRVVTQKMNFIPYNKVHNLILEDRNGEFWSLGFTNTGGFSKKTPADDLMAQVASVIAPTKPGIIFGPDDDAYAWCENNVPALIQKVDYRSLVQ